MIIESKTFGTNLPIIKNKEFVKKFCFDICKKLSLDIQGGVCHFDSLLQLADENDIFHFKFSVNYNKNIFLTNNFFFDLNEKKNSIFT